MYAILVILKIWLHLDILNESVKMYPRIHREPIDIFNLSRPACGGGKTETEARGSLKDVIVPLSSFEPSGVPSSHKITMIQRGLHAIRKEHRICSWHSRDSFKYFDRQKMNARNFFFSTNATSVRFSSQNGQPLTQPPWIAGWLIRRLWMICGRSETGARTWQCAYSGWNRRFRPRSARQTALIRHRRICPAPARSALRPAFALYQNHFGSGIMRVNRLGSQISSRFGAESYRGKKTGRLTMRPKKACGPLIGQMKKWSTHPRIARGALLEGGFSFEKQNNS